MKPILMRMGCVGMLLLAAGIVDGAGSRPYSSQAFWPLLLLAMGIAVGGMGLGVRAELLDPGKDPETKRPRGASAGVSRGAKEHTPADPAGICGAPFERSENGGASMPGPGGAGNWAGRFCKAKFCPETKRPRPCGNTDEAK
ncbi:MAG: hypothetical protein ACLTLX_07210, partial [Ruthenibacterium lactatiformans]